MKALNQIFSKHYRRLFFILLFSIAVMFQACSSNKQKTQTFSQNYQQNYPPVNSNSTGAKFQKTKSKGSFWKNTENERPLDLALVSHQTDQKKNQQNHIIRDDRSIMTVEENMSPPIRRYAAEDDLIGQNTSSMIEGKIYNLVEDAYKRRDYSEFIKLYSLFIESFPHSSQKGFLDEKRNTFFYQENLRVEKLQGALLDVSFPDAKTIQELGLYFERLRDKGINSVQMNVVQFMGVPVFLFANLHKKEGYYFSNSSNLTVDNILEQITKMAHDNGLKVYASFPLRHHPRIDDSAVFMLDETWDMFQNRTTSNSKLDLLNPDSRRYLFKLIDDLLKFDIDGIVLKDDFTYELNEGFSMVARDQYITATGRPLAFNKMFVPVRSKQSNHFEILTSDEFKDVSTWRSREITQLLWDIVEHTKNQKSNFQVGVEVTPEMLLERYDPIKWYSTGLSYLKDLNVDFYILKWTRYNSNQESDPEDYALAVDKLRHVVPVKKEIFLKIPLSQMTKNTIELNRKIDSHSEFMSEYHGIKIAVGPVNRVERLDIVN